MQHHTSPYRRWLPWIGALIGAATLAWVLRHFDFDRFVTTLAGTDWRFVAVMLLAIAAEQLVRAWKWRQLLYPMRPVGTLPLFGAIMAGYLLAFLLPFGLASIARSWLVARRESLKLSAVLATVALDRLTDGVVFACLVPIALLSVVFPDPTGSIRSGLVWAGAGSFVLFALLLIALAAYRHGALGADGRLLRLVDRLPARIAGSVRRVAASFAEGITWPRQAWRGAGIVLASAFIKVIAATHFLWAGLAFGVVLQPAQYLFLIVFLGFLVVLGHFIRLAGSFLIGAVFVLGLFGVAEEQAFAMALVVQTGSMLVVAASGALAMWQQGIALAQVRAAEGDGSVRSG
ncbi:MAG: lysylphosphatidylglycerol synthase transmembrane domain-containing protein [Rubrivivax sp.]